jgi:predicted flap endonuclease-1-like 5' DNA nuclease
MMRRVFRLILVLIIGYYITEWWLNQQKPLTESVKVTPPAKPQAPVAPLSNSSDLLVEIDGIGPAYEKALNAMGIRTFAQLAAQNADDLAVGLKSVRVTAARIKRDQWIEQAAARAIVPVVSRWSGNDGNSA